MSAATVDAEMTEYRHTFTKEDDWELDEHRFDGRAVLPEAAYPEAIVVGARHLRLPDTAGALVLRDLTYLAPIDGNAPVEVSVVFAPAAPGYRARVRSRRADGHGAWTIHATAMVAASGAEPAAIDIAGLRAGFDHLRTPETNEDLWFDEGWFQLGPRWDGAVRSAWRGDELLAELRLPPAFHADLPAHPVHPGLLGRSLLLQLPTQTVPTGPVVPALVRALTCFGPLPDRILVHVRVTDSRADMQLRDIDIYHSATGASLMCILGYALHATTRAELRARLGRAGASSPPTRATGLTRPDRREGSPDRSLAPQWVRGNDIEGGLRELWLDVLGVAEIGLDDDFFDLGGNSLVAVQLVDQICVRFAVDLDGAALFDASTIRLLAVAVADASQRPAPTPAPRL